jgi:mono/diheme cytochrome c family protein
MKRIAMLLLASLLLTLLAGLALVYHFASSSEESRSYPAPAVTPALLARGQYLVAAGNCVGCHTRRGGEPYAGNRVLPTPFGDMLVPNITADKQHGIGSWQADDFWRAMHHGKSQDGRMLYPAFPYTNYTKVTREDSDAMFAFLQTVAPVAEARQPHQLRFPYNQGVMLAAWRALYFRPGAYQPDAKQSPEWNRGAYLVQGLGHCNACHTSRNLLGASDKGFDLAGGMIPVLNWYAPSLTSDSEMGLGSWQQSEIEALLKTGVSNQGAVFGPMAEVVRQSLQHLDDADIRAMAHYLKALPQTVHEQDQVPALESMPPFERDKFLAQGEKLYETHCQDCHMKDGKGKPPDFPPLAGNRAITMPRAVNSIRIVLNGGFAPVTHGNPRPYSMPPYGPQLSDTEVAQVVSYIRHAWGNAGKGRVLVDASEVNRYRSVPLD